MTRWQRPLLVFSMALNVAFLSLAATHVIRNRDADVDNDAGSAAPDMRPEKPPRHSPMLQRWHEQRHHMVAKALDLDAAQQTAWDANFARIAPALPELHQRAMAARAAYRTALLRGDADAVRSTAAEVSRAQARIDSVCAEAMAGEASTLEPKQRARYVRWMFRGGPGRGGSPFGPGPFGRGLRHGGDKPPPAH